MPETNNGALNFLFGTLPSAASALNPSNFGQSRLGQIGQSVGVKLKQESERRQQGKANQARKLVESLDSPDLLRDLMDKLENQAAALTALSSTLDDQSIDMDQATVMALKEDLVRITDSITNDVDAKSMMESMVKTILNTGKVETIERLERNMRTYNNLGDQLVTPKIDTSGFFSTAPFTEFDKNVVGSMSPMAAQNLNALEGILKQHGGSGKNIQVVQMTGPRGQQAAGALYARILDNKGRFFSLAPLDITAQGNRWSADAPLRLKMGEFGQTGYVAPRGFVPAKAIDTALQTGGFNNKMMFDNMRTYEQFYSHTLSDVLEDAGGIANVNARVKSGLGSRLREVLVPDDRFTTIGSGPVTDIVNRGLAQQGAHVTIYGMEKLKKDRIDPLVVSMTRLDQFDVGVGQGSYFTAPVDGRRYSQVRLRANSPINFVRSGDVLFDDQGARLPAARRGDVTVGGVVQDRNFPVQARLEQNIGRIQGFVEKATAVGWGHLTTGSEMPAGILSATQSGATNRFMLLSLDALDSANEVVDPSRLSKMFDTTGGQAYTAGTFTTEATFKKAVLDPKLHGKGSTPLLEDVFEAAARGENIRFAAGKYSPLIGVGPDRSAFLPTLPGTESYEIGLQHSATAYGKRQHYLAGAYRRVADKIKGFSTAHKGTIMSVEEEAFENVLSTGFGLSSAEVQSRYNATTHQTVAAPSDMLKKAGANLGFQVISAFNFMGLGDVSSFEERTAQMSRQQAAQFGLPFTYGGRVTSAALTILQEKIPELEAQGRSLDPKTLGAMLAGIHRYGSKTPGFGVSKDQLEEAIRQSLGGRADGIIDAVRKSKHTFMLDAIAMGPGHETYKGARGSVETRSFEQLQQLMRTAGMKEGDISDILFNVYKNKVGMDQHLALTETLVDVQRSMGGRQIRDAEKLPIITYRDLAEANVDYDRVSDYMKTVDTGGFFDLGSVTGKNADVIKQAADEVFGGTKVFMPGGDAMRQGAEFSIKSSLGATGTTKPSSPMRRLVDDMSNTLTNLATGGKLTREEAVKRLTAIKEGAVKLSSDVYTQLLSGKIRGSGTHTLQGISITERLDLTEFQHAQAQKAFYKQGGSASWLSSDAFLSQMSDYAGTESEGAWKMRTFYTQMEAAGEQKGIMGFTTRHPILAMGNVDFGGVYRDPHEIGASRDRVWESFMQNEKMQSTVRNIESALHLRQNTITGFADIARFSSDAWMENKYSDQAVLGAKKRQVNQLTNQFFNQMYKNIEAYAGGKGGGAVFVGVDIADLHYGDQKIAVDLGSATKAMGDFDGDAMSVVFFDQKAGSLITNGIQSAKNSSYRSMKTKYAVSMQVFQAEAKASLNRHKEALEHSFRNVAEEDVLKEMKSQTSVGMVDVQLGRLRRAVLNAAGENMEIANQANSMLQVWQEHAVIKGKKLPVFMPFADRAARALDQLFSAGGSAEAFRHVLREDFFKESALWDGVEVKSLDGATELAKDASQHVKGMRVDMNEIVAFMERAAQQSLLRKDHYGGTSNMMSRSHMDQLASEALDGMIQRAQTARSGVLDGYRQGDGRGIETALQDAVEQVSERADLFGRKAVGPAALVAGAAFVVSGVLSGSAVSRDPVPPPQMQMNPGYQNRNVFQAPQQQAGRGTDAPSMGDRTINRPRTYMERPNAYQVSGSTSDSATYQRMRQHTSQRTGTSGSVEIIDHRHEITPSVIDRMMGY